MFFKTHILQAGKLSLLLADKAEDLRGHLHNAFQYTDGWWKKVDILPTPRLEPFLAAEGLLVKAPCSLCARAKIYNDGFQAFTTHWFSFVDLSIVFNHLLKYVVNF